MVGSKDTDHLMNVGDDDDDDGGSMQTQSSGVSCSICLELVNYNGTRSRAKLQCGHEFHLDCIGSAFNMKGAMQCPNCRKVEKGHWLFASGSFRSTPENSVEEWSIDDEPYEIAFPELPLRVHWCPFGGLTRVHSSFDEVESPSTAYHDLQGHHAIFAEHGASVTHSYVAYLGHLPPTASNSIENIDDHIFNHHWNMFSPHDFPPLSVQYHNRSHRSPPTSSHVSGADQASNLLAAPLRSARDEPDSMTRLGSSANPFLLGHGSGPRAGSLFVPSILPHHPGNSVRSHERVQLPHIIHHPAQPSTPPGMPSLIMPGVRRYNGPRSLPPVTPAASHSDQTGGFFVFPPRNSSGRNPNESENPLPIHVHPWERDYMSRLPATSDRDSAWASHHHATGGSDSSNRSGNFWQRNWS